MKKIQVTWGVSFLFVLVESTKIKNMCLEEDRRNFTYKWSHVELSRLNAYADLPSEHEICNAGRADERLVNILKYDTKGTRSMGPVNRMLKM